MVTELAKKNMMEVDFLPYGGVGMEAAAVEVAVRKGIDQKVF